MEARLLLVRINSVLQFVLIFLTIIRSYVHASTTGQAGYVDKYITKTYFEKHDSLIDPEFDNFIANEIPLTLCKVLEDGNCVLPTLSNLHRSVIGEGSHRHLSSSIIFKFQPELKIKLVAHSCEVIMTERLPSGVFADPFELQHLVQRGVFSDAAVFGDTNLELPSFRSNRSVVEIHMSIGSKMLSRHHDKFEINCEVPLHARYPPLGLGFSRVEFGQPDLFMCCSLEVNGFKRSCAYLPTNNISDYKASPLAWEIPCGIREHAGVVSAITYCFALVSALLIVVLSFCYTDNKGSSKPKSL
ncbi:phosphatidylinositol-glycan biosynthesis class X protein isoform X2 [Sesamum indicum]|nr:phosphatidylinositol-glycan biosynthesis class X protein isoform X2 [Sesamum indicum]